MWAFHFGLLAPDRCGRLLTGWLMKYGRISAQLAKEVTDRTITYEP
jgi:hypothetical protein